MAREHDKKLKDNYKEFNKYQNKKKEENLEEEAVKVKPQSKGAQRVIEFSIPAKSAIKPPAPKIEEKEDPLKKLSAEERRMMGMDIIESSEISPVGEKYRWDEEISRKQNHEGNLQEIEESPEYSGESGEHMPEMITINIKGGEPESDMMKNAGNIGHQIAGEDPPLVPQQQIPYGLQGRGMQGMGMGVGMGPNESMMSEAELLGFSEQIPAGVALANQIGGGMGGMGIHNIGNMGNIPNYYEGMGGPMPMGGGHPGMMPYMFPMYMPPGYQYPMQPPLPQPTQLDNTQIDRNDSPHSPHHQESRGTDIPADSSNRQLKLELDVLFPIYIILLIVYGREK